MRITTIEALRAMLKLDRTISRDKREQIIRFAKSDIEDKPGQWRWLRIRDCLVLLGMPRSTFYHNLKHNPDFQTLSTTKGATRRFRSDEIEALQMKMEGGEYANQSSQVG